MIPILFQYHIRRARRYFQSRRMAKTITAGAFLVIFGLVAFGLYLFFREGLAFIASDEFLVDALPLFVYELFLLVLGALVVGSAVITGLFMLYRNERDQWVMASPFYRGMPLYVFVRVYLASSWPLLVIAIPVLIAMIQVFDIGFGGAFLILLAVLTLIEVLVGAALALLLAVGTFLRMTLRRVSVGRAAIVIFLLLGALATYAWVHVGGLDVLEVFNVADLDETVANISLVSDAFSFFYPTHLTALLMLSVQTGTMVGAWYSLAALLLLDIILIAGFLLLSRYYLRVWQGMQETSFAARTDEGAARVRSAQFRSDRLPLLFLEKEARLMLRNTREVLWLLFLGSIWVSQTAMNLFVRHNMQKYDVETSAVPHMVYALQVIVVVYFIAAFVLRFAFPSFSTEYRTGWVVGAAPIPQRAIFYGKYVFYALLFTLLALVVGGANAWILQLDFVSLAGFITVIGVSAVTVTAFGTGMGALFPNFETDDPQVLSTSLPGLAVIVGSLLYGALGAAVVFFAGTGAFAPLLLVFLFFSALVTAAFLKSGSRALERVEVSGSL